MSAAPFLTVAIPSIQQATQNAARLLQQAMAMAAAAAGDTSVLSAADLALARSNIDALAFVQGVGTHGAYRYLRDFLARQAVPGSSSGAFLDQWLKAYGMARKLPARATGAIAGAGVVGSIVAAGAQLQRADGTLYKLTADATVISGGTISASVMAVDSGTTANAEGPVSLTLVASVPGVDSTWTCADGLSGGTVLETDSEAIYRLTQRLSAEPMGGSPADYARWALSVPGITRAWGLRNPAGPTSAGVVIMADANAPYGIPTAPQRQAVYDYISDPRRGPPDELFVISPTAQVIDLTISLSPDTAAIRADAQAALADLFYREAVPGGEMPHNHLIEVVSAVAGEYNHSYSLPTLTVGGVFTPLDSAHLLVLGTVSFA